MLAPILTSSPSKAPSQTNPRDLGETFQSGSPRATASPLSDHPDLGQLYLANHARTGSDGIDVCTEKDQKQRLLDLTSRSDAELNGGNVDIDAIDLNAQPRVSLHSDKICKTECFLVEVELTLARSLIEKGAISVRKCSIV